MTHTPCERCDRDDVPVSDYYEGHLGKRGERLLCAECKSTEAETAWERSCEDYYGGSTGETDAQRDAMRRLRR